MEHAFPYPINRSSDGVFYFATDAGGLYFCRTTDKTPLLSPLLGIYDIRVLEAEFFPYIPEGAETPGPDSRIAPTIIAFLRRLFATPETVVFYLCDASDGKHHGRHRLFRNWHEAYLQDGVTRLPVELAFETDDGGEQQILGSILLRADFPHSDVLKRELIDNVGEIFSEKFL